MRRETANRIRFVLEELFPPIIRDSVVFRWLIGLRYGRFAKEFFAFRRRAPYMTNAEFADFYRHYPRILDETDLSRICIDRIAEDAKPGRICDVGCGTGYLLRHLKAQDRLAASTFVGVDIAVEPLGAEMASVGALVEARLERLPFADRCFDTVICTHTLEHIFGFQRAVEELRRICSGRLIIVVPLERPYRYNFNPHLHFFAYPESFLAQMVPIPARHRCEVLKRDIYYREERPPERGRAVPS